MSGRLLYTDEAMEKALRAARGNRTRAAGLLGCAVSTVSAYVQRSEHLQAVERELVWSLVDRAEDVIRDHLDSGNLIASIFTLKTKGRDRGWSERLDVALSVDPGAPRISSPPPARSYAEWLAQCMATEQATRRLGPVDLDSIEDAEIADGEELVRVRPDEEPP